MSVILSSNSKLHSGGSFLNNQLFSRVAENAVTYVTPSGSVPRYHDNATGESDVGGPGKRFYPVHRDVGLQLRNYLKLWNYAFDSKYIGGNAYLPK